MDTFFEPKMSQVFCCKICDYNTSRIVNFRRHVSTDKHKKRANGYILDTFFEPNEPHQNANNSNIFRCICGNIYKFSQGLSKHKKKCDLYNQETIASKEQITPELILKIIEQNKDLTNVILKQNNTIHKLSDSSNNNITNNTQINNKTFNLNIYLNETCKNAMNIDEFVNNIKLSFEDLEYTGRHGYIEGISNIILKNLKRIGEYDRPIHCSDNKREILYIKSNNSWNKEEPNKPILTNAIKHIANHNIKQIHKWKECNPDCINSESDKNNLYLKIISNSMCGIDKEETNKNINKIVSKVAKVVTINKNN